MIARDSLSQQEDTDLHGDAGEETQERRQEDKEVTQLCDTALAHSAAR